jgi:hypothetical protein
MHFSPNKYTYTAFERRKKTFQFYRIFRLTPSSSSLRSLPLNTIQCQKQNKQTKFIFTYLSALCSSDERFFGFGGILMNTIKWKSILYHFTWYQFIRKSFKIFQQIQTKRINECCQVRNKNTAPIDIVLNLFKYLHSYELF